MPSVNVFVYGTLMADQIAGKLLGRVPASCQATLQNHIRYKVKGHAFPAIVEKEGETVEGKLLKELNAKELSILDEYEAEEYDRHQVVVTQASGDQARAFVYVWAPQFESMLDPVPWDFDFFMKNDFSTYWAAELES
eukprot:jgi/Ulvmu1/9578/UM054_0008.1